MGIIVKDLLDHVTGALGAQALSNEQAAIDIVNDAGNYLCSMHAWNWLDRAEATVDFVADQSWAALPAGIREITDITYTDSLTQGFRWITLAELNQVRNGIEPDWRYSGAIEWVQPASGGAVAPRLALTPTPQSDLADAFTFRYKAEWVDVGTDGDLDTDEVIVPKFLAALAKRLVRIFAKAWEEEEEGTLEQQLELLEQSTFLARMKERDGAFQPEMGVLQGGAAQQVGLVINWDSEDGMAAPS